MLASPGDYSMCVPAPSADLGDLRFSVSCLYVVFAAEMGASLLYRCGFEAGKKVGTRATSCKWCEMFLCTKRFVRGMH